MNKNILIRRQSYRWQLDDKLRSVQGCPTVIDPDTGEQVEPIDISLSYCWDPRNGTWCIAQVEVDGPVRSEDGEYSEAHRIIDFYDPVRGEEGQGKAPSWLLKLAEQRRKRLPAGPSAEPSGGER